MFNLYKLSAPCSLAWWLNSTRAGPQQPVFLHVISNGVTCLSWSRLPAATLDKKTTTKIWLRSFCPNSRWLFPRRTTRLCGKNIPMWPSAATCQELPHTAWRQTLTLDLSLARARTRTRKHNHAHLHLFSSLVICPCRHRRHHHLLRIIAPSSWLAMNLLWHVRPLCSLRFALYHQLLSLERLYISASIRMMSSQ